MEIKKKKTPVIWKPEASTPMRIPKMDRSQAHTEVEWSHKVLASELLRSENQATNNPSQACTGVRQVKVVCFSSAQRWPQPTGLHEAASYPLTQEGSAAPTDVLQKHICKLVCPDDGQRAQERRFLCAREDRHGSKAFGAFYALTRGSLLGTIKISRLPYVL